MVNENTLRPLAATPTAPTSSTSQQSFDSQLWTIPKRKAMSSAPSNLPPAKSIKSAKHMYTARETEWIAAQLQDPEVCLLLQSDKGVTIRGITKTRVHERIATNMERTFPNVHVDGRQIKNKISRMKIHFRAADAKKREPEFASLDEEQQKTLIEDICPFYFSLHDSWGKCWTRTPTETENERQKTGEVEESQAEDREDDDDDDEEEEEEEKEEEVWERRSKSQTRGKQPVTRPVFPQPGSHGQEQEENVIAGDYPQLQFRGQALALRPIRPLSRPPEQEQDDTRGERPRTQSHGQASTSRPTIATRPASTSSRPTDYQKRRLEQMQEQPSPTTPELPNNVIPKTVMDQINYLFAESTETRKSDSAYDTKKLEARKMESAYELRRLEASILEKKNDHERRMMMDRFEHERMMAQIHAETRDHERRRALIEAEQRDQDRSLRRQELDVLAREQTLQLGFMRQYFVERGLPIPGDTPSRSMPPPPRPRPPMSPPSHPSSSYFSLHSQSSRRRPSEPNLPPPNPPPSNPPPNPSVTNGSPPSRSSKATQ
ncbi:hypothetical protein MVEG_11955 [Podila verticillata NRRL 6337]|uniref:Uncharacterized protein n=1 Tax=Podila verticillata NRRL 6337 TaxID=1069443 RepID=A0A086TKT5_9FUNG|nr:hypothetical protein MVEG_11955 [Podila verticillata NRRL 6337]